MPAVCRLGDPVSCGDNMIEGSGNVFAEGSPVCRVRVDKTAGHCFLPTVVSSGSENVFVNGSAVVRIGDPIIPHTCPPPPSTHGGALSAGATNVFANGE